MTIYYRRDRRSTTSSPGDRSFIKLRLIDRKVIILTSNWPKCWRATGKGGICRRPQRVKTTTASLNDSILPENYTEKVTDQVCEDLKLYYLWYGLQVYEKLYHRWRPYHLKNYSNDRIGEDNGLWEALTLWTLVYVMLKASIYLYRATFSLSRVTTELPSHGARCWLSDDAMRMLNVRHKS